MYGYSIITVYSYFNLYVPGNFEPLVVKVSNNKLYGYYVLSKLFVNSYIHSEFKYSIHILFIDRLHVWERSLLRRHGEQIG